METDKPHHYDMNSDGEITEEEINKIARIRADNAKFRILRDQSKMAWFALFCMGSYPGLMVLCSVLGFNEAANLLSGITGVYFGSIAVVVAAFMGSEAYSNSRASDFMHDNKPPKGY